MVMKMHKIGLISDIHGNDLAFKEVLKRLNDVDEIICLGDMIGIGPNSNEVVDIAKCLNKFSCVMGNHERYLLYGFDNPLSCLSKDDVKWTNDSISKENVNYIKSLPLEIRRTYNNKELVFMHYARFTLESLMFTVIVKDPNGDSLDELFLKHGGDYIFYGHEHIKSEFDGKKKYIDVGSLGCPYPDKDKARYGILTIDDDIKYEGFEFTYDSSIVVNDMERKKMPNRDFVSKAFYLNK